MRPSVVPALGVGIGLLLLLPSPGSAQEDAACLACHATPGMFAGREDADARC
ncbi:MAG: hypothetical protein ACE5HF_06005 [Gemmatimonadota bacterium]